MSSLIDVWICVNAMQFTTLALPVACGGRVVTQFLTPISFFMLVMLPLKDPAGENNLGLVCWSRVCFLAEATCCHCAPTDSPFHCIARRVSTGVEISALQDWMEGPALINNVTVENNRWVQCGLMGGAPVSVQENTSVVLRNNTAS